MPLTERDVEQIRKIYREESKREREFILDSDPYNPERTYKYIRDRLYRDLGEGTFKQASRILVQGMRAFVVMACIAAAQWFFDIKAIAVEVYKSLK